MHAPGEGGLGLMRAGVLGLLEHQGEDETQHCRHDREQDHLLERPAQPQEQCGQERPRHRAGIVHGAVQAEGEPARAAIDARGEQGVARRGAQSLAHAVGETQRQHHRPAHGQRDHGTGKAGQRIARHHPRLGAAGAVDDDAGEEFEEAGGGLGDALDDAERARPGHQHRGEEQRHQRIDHLAGRVVDQADEADQPHGAREREQGFQHAVSILQFRRSMKPLVRVSPLTAIRCPHCAGRPRRGCRPSPDGASATASAGASPDASSAAPRERATPAIRPPIP